MSQQETLGSLPLTIAPAVSPSKPLMQADSGRAHPEAVFLEVPVKIHGSRVLEVVRWITPHTEPFEEQTVTLIVFPGGGVVRMRTAMHAEHVVVLTNLKSGQDAIGRVSRVRPCGNQQVYVEVEFATAQPGFWGVEFPSERSGEETKAGPAAPPAARAVAPMVEARIDDKVISSVVPLPANFVISPASKSPVTITDSAPAAPSATARAAGPASAFVSMGESEEVELAATETSALRRDWSSKSEIATEPVGVPEAVASVAAQSSPAHLPSALGSSEGTESFDLAREASFETSGTFGTRAAFGTLAGAGQNQEPRRNWVLIVTCAAVLLAAGGGGAAYWVNDQLSAELPAIPLPLAPAPPAEITSAQNLPAPPVAQTNAGTSLGDSAPNAAEAVHADVAPSVASAGAGRRGGELAGAGGSPAARPRMSQALALDAGVPVKAPRLVSETKPVYPATARQAGVDGNVVVRIVIDKAGNVVDARAIAGPEMLRGAAVDAVRQWRYEPSTLNGQPVPVQMPVTIPFRR
jgi:periplasmic protein TonB